MSSGRVIKLSDFVLANEPPLSPVIEEKRVVLPARDGSVITGIVNYPKDKPVHQKALFLHAIEGDADNGVMRVLARRYAQIGIASLRIDFRGHGERKAQWQEYSPQSMLNDAQASIDWMDDQWPEINKTMLCGFSTGGAAALMTRTFDDRVSKTCLLYPVLSFQHNFLAAIYPDSALIMPLTDWDMYTPWRKGEFTKEKLEASLNDNANFSLTVHTYGAGFIKGCKEIVDAGLDVLTYLGARVGDAPVTVLQGTTDGVVPLEYADGVHAAVGPRVPLRLVILQGMNHYVPLEWKESVIKQFIKAAETENADFNPRRTVVTLAARRDFLLSDLLPR